jgi:hypothetical protein
MTAGGRFLGRTPVEGLAAWRALPVEERRPGAITIESAPIGANTAQPSPPADGLIMRLFYRQLARDNFGYWRLATQEDFPFGNGRVNLNAQPNYLWLTEAEWKSLLPAEPTENQEVQVSLAIADRICLQYLDPVLSFCLSPGWRKE